MALGDPFGSALQAAQERSQGIERGTGMLAEAAQQFGMQGMRGQQAQDQLKYASDLEAETSKKNLENMMPMLKQMGIYKEEETPLTIKDWQEHAKKNYGVELNASSKLPEAQQLETVAKLSEAMGVKPPQTTKKTVIDLDTASKAGFSMDSNGKVIVAPIKPDSAEDLEYKQARTDYYKTKAGSGDTLSPSLQKQKKKDTSELIGTVRRNELGLKNITSAKNSLTKVPQGLLGKYQISLMKQADPSNPILTDWQNLKSVLTDAQLMQTAKTKGAISDSEMKSFAVAVANDDLASIARMTPVLERLENHLNTETGIVKDSYLRNWSEDPNEILGSSKSVESGLKEGAVEDGYTFKGGDPADPKNWEKQ